MAEIKKYNCYTTCKFIIEATNEQDLNNKFDSFLLELQKNIAQPLLFANGQAYLSSDDPIFIIERT